MTDWRMRLLVILKSAGTESLAACDADACANGVAKAMPETAAEANNVLLENEQMSLGSTFFILIIFLAGCQAASFSILGLWQACKDEIQLLARFYTILPKAVQ